LPKSEHTYFQLPVTYRTDQRPKLCYSYAELMVAGIEPRTLQLQGKCSTGLTTYVLGVG